MFPASVRSLICVVLGSIALSSLARTAIAQCPHAGNGVGSIPYPAGGPYQGVAFRVWAPNASSVGVIGPASNESVPLVEQGGTGYWCKDVPGVSVNELYDYVITSPGFGTVTRRDPNARVVTAAHDGFSITYDPGAYVWQDQSFTPPPLNKLAIYVLDTGTFYADNSTWGTFQASISKLSEITGMGFNAVELLPVTQFDGIYANPYAPTDQYAVDKDEYGGPDNLKAFVNACHQQGLAVIMDVVHNHWGPFDLNDYRFDGWHTSDYPDGIYFYDDAVATGDRRDSPWGSRPDYSNADVAQYISNQIAMWFDEYHADGLRWDSVSNIYNAWQGGAKDPHTGKPGVALPDGVALLQNANTTWPATFKIAEDLSFSKTQAQDTLPVSSGGLGFDSQWNATLGYYIRKDFPSTGAISMSDVIAGMTSNFNNSPLQSVIYVESQDELDQAGSRLYQLVDPQDPTSRTARKKACLAAALVFTTPGVPMVYQGDEFLDPSWADFKTMLTWSNAQTWSGIINLYGAVVRLRTDAGGTSPGLVDTDLNTYQQDKTNDVMVYDRYNKSSPGSDDVIVVVNLSATVFSGGYEIGLPYGGIWQVLFNSDSQTYSSDFGNVGPTGSVTASNAPYDGQPYSATIPIGDYSVIILSQK